MNEGAPKPEDGEEKPDENLENKQESSPEEISNSPEKTPEKPPLPNEETHTESEKTRIEQLSAEIKGVENEDYNSWEWNEETEDAYAKQWLENHPEPTQEQKDLELEVAKFEKLISDFEQKYSLEELNNITKLSRNLNSLFIQSIDKDNYSDPEVVLNSEILLSEEEKAVFKIRAESHADLIPINNVLNSLRSMLGESDEEYKKLAEKNTILSRAIGYIRKNEVFHD